MVPSTAFSYVLSVGVEPVRVAVVPFFPPFVILLLYAGAANFAYRAFWMLHARTSIRYLGSNLHDWIVAVSPRVSSGRKHADSRTARGGYGSNPKKITTPPNEVSAMANNSAVR